MCLPPWQSGSGDGALQTFGLPLGLKRHPTHGVGLKVKKKKPRSKVLPCVFTGSDVSASPQRLWPGAHWTIAVQGPERESTWCTACNRRRPHHEGRQGERTKRPPLPSPLGLRVNTIHPAPDMHEHFTIQKATEHCVYLHAQSRQS